MPGAHAIDAQTQLCAVIGHPVGHSLSPAIHNAGFAATGYNAVYLAFDVTDVPAFLAGLRAMPNFLGLSITIPHKAAVIPHLDACDTAARDTGSVNTILHRDRQLIGSSTDGPGTLRAFAQAGIDIQGKRVLFLGAGGAVRAVAFRMARAGAAQVSIRARRLEQAAALAHGLTHGANCQADGDVLGNETGEEARTYDIVVNGTPLGMAPDREADSPLPAGALHDGQTVFDMVYKPLETRFIQDARRAGCQIVLGSEMLLQQALLQFETWTGVPAPEAAMRQALMERLA